MSPAQDIDSFHNAQAVTVQAQGRRKHFIRVVEDEETFWYRAKDANGLPDTRQPYAAKLTPAELADLLTNALE